MYPDNYKYTKEHEWILVEGDTGTIGITDHAQHELGDIVYVDLPKAGTAVEAGQGARLGGIGEGGVRYLLARYRRGD
jgi:glycine cleavage system H lipoate-binding protein